MIAEDRIALKERINELKARIATLGRWEIEKAFEIQNLIRQQAEHYDKVCKLEKELERS